MTVRQLLAEGRAYLSPAVQSGSIGSPSLDASLLLGEVLNCTKEKLTAEGSEEVLPEQAGEFRQLLERRINGECTAYILGRKEFFGLEFLVNPAVLVPRPETETLVEAALKAGGLMEKAPQKKIRLLDLCSGSGAIAVSLKHEKPAWEVFASDISAAALVVAKKNAERLLQWQMPEVPGIVFIESDLFSGIQGSFDIIVSNPPYVASSEIGKLPPEVRREPSLALDGGKDGLEIIRRIIEDAPGHLNPGGEVILEADPRQMETIMRIFLDNGFAKPSIVKDLSARERVICAAYS